MKVASVYKPYPYKVRKKNTQERVERVIKRKKKEFGLLEKRGRGKKNNKYLSITVFLLDQLTRCKSHQPLIYPCRC
jgi:hypothetical protein